MNALAKFLSRLLALAAFIAGGYFIFWVFVGGIIEFSQGVSSSPANTHDVVWGILRVTVLTVLGLTATYWLLVKPAERLRGVAVLRWHRRLRRLR